MPLGCRELCLLVVACQKHPKPAKGAQTWPRSESNRRHQRAPDMPDKRAISPRFHAVSLANGYKLDSRD